MRTWFLLVFLLVFLAAAAPIRGEDASAEPDWKAIEDFPGYDARFTVQAVEPVLFHLTRFADGFFEVESLRTTDLHVEKTTIPIHSVKQVELKSLRPLFKLGDVDQLITASMVSVNTENTGKRIEAYRGLLTFLLRCEFYSAFREQLARPGTKQDPATVEFNVTFTLFTLFVANPGAFERIMADVKTPPNGNFLHRIEAFNESLIRDSVALREYAAKLAGTLPVALNRMFDIDKKEGETRWVGALKKMFEKFERAGPPRGPRQ
ncbi:MAG: hypothetical protein WC712_10555 [Candidatus Brocadiia bacterium]